MLQVARSQNIAYPTGGGGDFTLPMDFLPDKNEDGWPVITEVLIKIAAQYDTGGGITAFGATLAKALKRLHMSDGQGEFVNLTGPQIRLLDIFEHGVRAFADPADVIAATNNQARTTWLRLNFAPRMSRRRYDYCVPVRNLKHVAGAEIKIDFPTASELGFTGGDPTVDSITFTIYVLYRREHDLQFHTRRELRSVQLTDTNTFYLPVHGRSVRAAILHKASDTASGGTSLSSLTGVTAEPFKWSNLDPEVFRRLQLHESVFQHSETSTVDPFMVSGPLAFSLIHPRADGKILEFPVHEGQPMIELHGNSVSQLQCVLDLVVDRTEASQMGDMDAAKRSGVVTQIKVKTVGRTMTNPEKLPKRAARRMPAKAVLAR